MLNFAEALNLNAAITSTWNNYPFSRKSLLSPSSFVNPHAELYSLQIEVIGGSITSAMSDLMDEVQKGALEFILDSQGLEPGNDPEFEKIEPGHTVCYRKNEDTGEGLIFATIQERQGSDFVVLPSNSNDTVKISKQRVILLPTSSPFEMETKELELRRQKSDGES